MARLRAVTLDDLATLLGGLNGGPAITARATRMVVARWQALGLAQTHPNPRGGRAIVTATRDGWGWAVGRAPDAIGLPAWRDLPHTLSVAAVAIHLHSQAPGSIWASDDELRLSGLEHRPDGVMTLPDGQRYAIEVERVQKASTRWAEIIPAHLSTWAGVAYYCRGGTGAALTRWASQHLTTEDRKRLAVCDLGGMSR